MKSSICGGILVLAVALTPQIVQAQAFTNLNFESANIPSSTPTASLIPISEGLPGWNACFISSTATNQVAEITYDAISLGGNEISIVDTNVGFGFNPIQGNYSVFLFGGGSTTAYAAQISQSGLVPSGTKSLQLWAQPYGWPFIVTLGGQTITMSPLLEFSNYTIYGGNIPPSLAGQVAMLSITEPAPINMAPSELELDHIGFLPNSIPEPGVLSLFGLGGLIALLPGFRRWKKSPGGPEV